ncbi:uncharacterized protein LOC113327692 [Papaver somniferum]|uniref:uncharacterized protein LOC113327692 n=1 Tax=Papaver somniferum TaxID=3469 RepID=UPI000E7011A7|nr:uncharacterized protein LOC113327692 [Papaver somniferum]
MKYNDYDGAKKKLIEAQTSYPGLEYVDELIKLCDIAITAKSQGSGIDWYSVLDISKTANVSDIEFKFMELMRTLEPVKNKFPEIQSALRLIEKAYSEFETRKAASLVPCGSVKPLDIAHSETVNIDSGATSQSSSGSKRIVSEDSDNNSLICNTGEQPLKRVRSLGGNDCEFIAETQSFHKHLGKICGQEASSDNAINKTRVNETEGSENLMKAMVHKEPALATQNVKKLITYSRRRHLSPRTCEAKKSQVDGTSKDENTSSDNLEMDRSSSENVVNLTAKNDGEKVAEEIDLENDGFSLENDCEFVSETQSLSKLTGKVCGEEVTSDIAKCSTRSNEVEGSLGRFSGSGVKSIVCNYKKDGAFAVGQCLAVYDQEKMPRLYAKITRIEHRYKKETNSSEEVLYFRWLRPAPVNADERKWHEAGLPVSCGFFKMDGYKIDKCDKVVFSHLVSSFQEYRYSEELVELYPQAGEVWAIYKDWKPFDWCSDPKTGKGCKFLLVEILSDYSIATGVKVAPMVKVAGYKAIFQRSSFSYQIAARNLFGFSHNIPVRSAGDMKGLFAGSVFDLNRLSIPKDVVVGTVAAKFSNGSSIRHQNPGFPRTSSVPNPEINTGNQYAGYVAPGNQNVKQHSTTSRLRLLSPKSCEVNKSQADGTSKGCTTSSNNLELDGSSRQNVRNLTAKNDEEKLAGKVSGQVSSGTAKHRSTDIQKELVQLYPQAGEVWAVYKDWKPFGWCSDPKTRKECKFLLVEILTDHSPAAGVKVASLGKVAGYSTIFRRSGQSYHIAASKLLGFSHNLPVRSTGDMKGLFAGTVLDLDPLSIPKDVVVDTVAAEFSYSSRIKHQNSTSAPITSM